MDFLQKLELEDSLPTTTAAQKEANKFRREMFMNLTRKRDTPTPTVFTDFTMELLTKRLQNKEYRLSSQSLLHE